MNAKEMFEKLGYKYYEDDIYFLKYYVIISTYQKQS